MSADPPIIRPVSLLAVCLQIGLILLLAWAFATIYPSLNFPAATIVAAGIYTLVFRVSRAVLTRDHRRGIALFRAKKFAEAAPLFEASYQAMLRHPAIDRYRWLILGGTSSLSYREMALCNAAFCYSQIDEGQKAISLYEKALSEFPNSGVATASLNMIRSVSPKPL